MLYCDRLQDNLNGSLWLESLEKGEKQSLTVVQLTKMILKVTDFTKTILTVAYLTKMILTVTYLTKSVSLSLNFTTSFQSPALLFLTHVTQLPCFQAKIHETEVSHSRGAWNQKLQVPSFKPKYMTEVLHSHVAWKRKLQVPCFQT